VDSDPFKRVANLFSRVLGAEFLDGLEAAAGEDIAQVDAGGWDLGACGGACEGAVLAGRQAVDEGEVVELSRASAFLNEAVVKIVQAAGIRAQEDPVGGEVLADRGSIDAVEEALEFGKFFWRDICSPEGFEGLGGGGGEWDNPSWEFAVECDGLTTGADE
jgi:hypothetical protein